MCTGDGELCTAVLRGELPQPQTPPRPHLSWTMVSTGGYSLQSLRPPSGGSGKLGPACSPGPSLSLCAHSKANWTGWQTAQMFYDQSQHLRERCLIQNSATINLKHLYISSHKSMRKKKKTNWQSKYLYKVFKSQTPKKEPFSKIFPLFLKYVYSPCVFQLWSS